MARCVHDLETSGRFRETLEVVVRSSEAAADGFGGLIDSASGMGRGEVVGLVLTPTELKCQMATATVASTRWKVVY